MKTNYDWKEIDPKTLPSGVIATPIKNMNEQKKVVLTRTGERPLAFTGVKLTYASNRGNDSTRWASVKVYETDSKKIVVGIGYHTIWDGEETNFLAKSFDSMESAMIFLEENISSLVSEIAAALDISETI